MMAYIEKNKTLACVIFFNQYVIVSRKMLHKINESLPDKIK